MNMTALLRLLACCALLLAAPVHALRITPAHSGTWYDPAFDKQGFVIEVLGKAGNGPERIATVQWYTYDDAGRPVWAVGVGTTDGHQLALTLQQASGGARPPAQVEASDLVDFADVLISFGDCHRASADFEMSADGSVGHYDLQRLTQIGASHCTGGISDELDPRAEPLTLVVPMTAANSLPDAQGLITFKSRPALVEFEVELRRLPAGDYSLRVAGEVRGQISVAATGNGNGVTRGQIRYASPAGPDSQLLDFDPLGQLVEVFDSTGAPALSATLAPRHD